MLLRGAVVHVVVLRVTEARLGLGTECFLCPGGSFWFGYLVAARALGLYSACAALSVLSKVHHT
jgi:hypothetical protein